MKQKSFIYPIVFMSVITAIFTFVLAYLNYSTADRIEFLQDTDLRKKLLYVFDIPTPSDDPEDIEAVFNKHIQEDKSTEPPIYYTVENDKITGYAIPADGAGLWGSIDAYVGISSDYTKILGLEFIQHSETPGLGGRISEPEFLEQFRGLDISSPINGEYIIYNPAPGGNIDAISGATLTSQSVSALLNIDIQNFLAERKGEQ
ncbi:MAG: FMN-binding protein [Tissierellaceae bacterium]|nr:FMN-binding protein [Tissierellaceae bacterium]